MWDFWTQILEVTFNLLVSLGFVYKREDMHTCEQASEHTEPAAKISHSNIPTTSNSPEYPTISREFFFPY